MKYFQCFFVMTFMACIALSNYSSAQQKDDLVKKAEILLHDYKIITPQNVPPLISPEQAWKKKYQDEIKLMSENFGSGVIRFSSQYSAGSWSANQILGAPNFYPGYGDNSNTWTFSSADGQREWIEVGFSHPEPIDSISIYETFNPGAIDTVYVKNPNTGNWEIVWSDIAAPAPAVSRIFTVYFAMTSFPVSQVRLAINSPAVPGWNEYDAISIPSNYIEPYKVNTMPSYNVSTLYGNVLINSPVEVWGNAAGGTPPYRYKLEYGDGTVDSGDVIDPHFIGNAHTYTNAGNKTITLSVWDAANIKITDQSVLRVFAAATQQININIAIEKGLLYLYKNQNPDGHWDGENNIAVTAIAVLSFEENGHLITNDFDNDIYAEFVKKGLNWLLLNTYTYDISVQPQGNPDSDGDGIGVYFGDGNNYANGIALLAVLGAHSSAAAAQANFIEAGPYWGQSYYDFMVDAIDQIAFSQTDPASGSQRGGWRYQVNTPDHGTSDNSAVQWPGLVLEAAEKSWGMPIAQWVKDELLIWLIYSQDIDGSFGYQAPGQYSNLGKTGAGIGSYALLNYSSDSTVIINALNFCNAHWNDTYDPYGWRGQFYGNLYSLYATAKGFRIINNRLGIVNVYAHNWYDEYSNLLLTHAEWGQKEDGHWENYEFFTAWPMCTGFAILILTQGVIVAPPVAIIELIVQILPLLLMVPVHIIRILQNLL